MAYDPGAIDATLAAAVGDEPELIQELRDAFADSARRLVEALRSADTPALWHSAALRLKSLAGSFGAVRLMDLAEEALNGDPGDPALLRRIIRNVNRV